MPTMLDQKRKMPWYDVTLACLHMPPQPTGKSFPSEGPSLEVRGSPVI